MNPAHNPHRSVCLIAAIGLFAAACADSSNDTQSTPATTEVELSDDVAANTQAVFAALDVEANDWMASEVEFGMWEAAQSLPVGAHRWYFCDLRQSIKASTLEALPERIGDDGIDAVYRTLLDARVDELAALGEACEVAAQARDALESSEAAELAPVVYATSDAVVDACFAALDAFSPYGVLNCDAIPTETDRFIDLPTDDIYEALDVDPNWRQDTGSAAAGLNDECPDTGSLFSEWVLVGPGEVECLWFARPFVIDHPEGVLMQSTPDSMGLTRLDETAVVYLWALDELSDPEDPVAPGPTLGRTIPFPDDLTDFWAAMPVEVIESDDFDVDGTPVTRWIIRGVEAGIRAATGDQVVQFGLPTDPSFGPQIQGGVYEPPPDLPEDQRSAPTFNEELVYAFWHIRTPTGPLLAEVSTFTEFGSELEWATELIESLQFTEG